MAGEGFIFSAVRPRSTIDSGRLQGAGHCSAPPRAERSGTRRHLPGGRGRKKMTGSEAIREFYQGNPVKSSGSEYRQEASGLRAPVEYPGCPSESAMRRSQP